MAHEISYSTKTQRNRMGSTQKEWHWNETHHTIWETNPTCSQVIEDLDMGTEVMLRTIYDADNNPIEEIRETYRPDFDAAGKMIGGKRLGIVGPDWTPIQDKDFVNWFEPWVEAGFVQLESFGAIMGGSRVFGLGMILRDPIDIQADDPVASYLAGYNGHDGKIAFKCGPSNIRTVCKNTVTAWVSDRMFRKFSIRHNQNVEKRVEEIRLAVAEADGMFLSQCERFKTLASGNVKSAADLKLYFQKILGAKKEDPTLTSLDQTETPEDNDSKNLIRKLTGLYENGTGNKGKTYWDAYNAWTEFTTHLRGRTMDARLDKMYTGSTAAGNLLALGYGLAAIKGENIANLTPVAAKKMAFAA